MTLFFNRTSEKSKRKFLRHHMTKAETILRSRLRGKQLLGYKFRRQYSVGAFVIDFYSPNLKLAIEVDGESHKTRTAMEYDVERETYLKQFGIRVIRFSNDEVCESLHSVVDRITKAITNPGHFHVSTTSPSSSTSLRLPTGS